MRKLFLTALLCAIAAPAWATDVTFSFSDGSTSYFYGRDHVPGTVTGTLIGLTDNATSLPTAIKFTSVPGGLQFITGTYVGNFFSTPGITLAGGNVVASNLFFNFNDAANNAFQLRLNCTDSGVCGTPSQGLNSLFWNGGATPVVGTGNQNGFAGATYGASAAVPEPATWAMMLLGFGGAGYVLRRRRDVGVRVRYA